MKSSSVACELPSSAELNSTMFRMRIRRCRTASVISISILRNRMLFASNARQPESTHMQAIRSGRDTLMNTNARPNAPHENNNKWMNEWKIIKQLIKREVDEHVEHCSVDANECDCVRVNAERERISKCTYVNYWLGISSVCAAPPWMCVIVRPRPHCFWHFIFLFFELFCSRHRRLWNGCARYSTRTSEAHS